FTVTLSAASGLPISVDYAMTNGTAGAGDYTAGTGTLSFAAGVLTQTITVPITDDLLDELDEDFTVNLANPTNATIANGAGVGTILDNDTAPSLSINELTANESAGTASFTATLRAASCTPISINLG